MLYNIYENFHSNVGINRGLKIIEKNKVIKGRNKQNTLSMDLNINVKNELTRNIYFNSVRNISKVDFDSFEAKHTITPTDYFSIEAVREIIPGLPVSAE